MNSCGNLRSYCQPYLRLHARLLSSRPHPAVDKVIRVDHAGEFVANRIYAGQVAVLGETEVGELIQVIFGGYVSIF